MPDITQPSLSATQSHAVIWCDGEWVSDDQLFIHHADRGVLHGLGAFETMRAENGKLLRADAHLRRFFHATHTMGLAAYDLTNLPALAHELCERNNCARGIARIRLTATAGVAPMEDGRAGGHARCWLTAQTCQEQATPVVLGYLPWTKNEKSPLVGIKSANYAENILAMRHARSMGWNEGIYLNNQGHICEAIMANIFCRIAGEILTPPLSSGCLPGIMRAEVLTTGIARETNLTPDDLTQAEAIWLTSSLRGVVSVASITQRQLQVMDMRSRG